MAQRVLGTLTIGQTPPPDIAPIIDRYVPERVRRIHRGLLDGLSQPDIEALYGIEQGGPILVTRLFDGSSMQLSGAKVERGVQVKLDALEQEGCEVILLLCTGRFRGLQCRQCWLLQPDEIIPPMVAGLLRHPCSGSSCRSLRKYIRKGANGAASGDRRS
jgi:protein AroM